MLAPQDTRHHAHAHTPSQGCALHSFNLRLKKKT
ncbi:unnamed protein product [Spirodela intermedia]|uniref:Uncharacterized protein n=1 Tax=Spirodela intermedia TaxID=51605 RepID=A0A7I8IQ91_SPIIN|nr:unnamed protein product [Spirodela intermedia]CAA6659962.1 unnamed protein product [Spirodela intermedia]